MLNKNISLPLEIRNFIAPEFQPNNDRATFDIYCEPEIVTDNKRLNLFQRKPVSTSITMQNFKGVKEIFTKLNPDFENIINTAKKTNKLFFFQTNLLTSKEKFVVIAGDENYSCENFKYEAVLQVVNKALHKIGKKYNILIKLNSSGHIDIYLDGEPYEVKFLRDLIKEYPDLKKALINCLNPKYDFTKYQITKENASDLLKYIFFSDLHLANKTSKDNFGTEKEDSLIEFLNKNRNYLKSIGGDFLDLWQNPDKNEIKEKYKNLFTAIREQSNVVIEPGNHDEDLETPTGHLWLNETLPNVSLFPALFTKFDQNSYFWNIHGDVADPANNYTKIGKTISKLAMLIEKVYPLAEQRLEHWAHDYLASTKLLIQRDVLNNLTVFVAMINAFLFFKKEELKKLSENEKMNLVLIMGHTHDMIKHNEKNNILQRLLSVLMNQFEEAKNLNIFYINTGAGSGYIDRKDLSKGGRQNSVTIEKRPDGKWYVNYTTKNYNQVEESIPLEPLI